MGKLRYDRNSDGLRLGQALLRADSEILDEVTGSIVVSAGDDRHALDINEAWLAWNPVPSGPWKTRIKTGAFFPATSIEIDYDSVGWTPTRTLSSSAINSWIGEEIRTKGVEINLSRKGRFDGSPHDYGFTAAVYSGNDPTGTLLAWRGWAIGDRISGLSKPILLADLPVYRASGAINVQDRAIHVFREIDGRPGYYVGAQYAYAGWIEAAALHYDNRGDPLKIKDRQYSWATRFDHLSLRLRPGGAWEVLFQALRGATLMGPNAVSLDFRAWYALASHPLGGGNLAMRFDQFSAHEHDLLPSDPNGERGRALALAYSHPINQSFSVISELLMVRSSRTARLLIDEAGDQSERSLSLALRWQF